MCKVEKMVVKLAFLLSTASTSSRLLANIHFLHLLSECVSLVVHRVKIVATSIIVATSLS